MKVIGASLLNRLTTGTGHFCRLFTLTRADGVIFRFTDHDQDISFGGDLYRRDNALSIANISIASGTNITASNCSFIFDEASGIDPLDVVRGVYDSARLKVSWIDWEFPAYGEAIVLVGNLGVITLTNKRVGEFEIKGILNKGDMRIGLYYTAECTADFGDHRCQYALAGVTHTGTITSVLSRTKFLATLSSNQIDGYFSLGVLTWTGGDNNGKSMEVLNQFAASVTEDQITIALEMPEDPQVGDTFSIVAGCDKRIATCISKFNNVANNRSYPFVPGSDNTIVQII